MRNGAGCPPARYTTAASMNLLGQSLPTEGVAARNQHIDVRPERGLDACLNVLVGPPEQSRGIYLRARHALPSETYVRLIREGCAQSETGPGRSGLINRRGRGKRPRTLHRINKRSPLTIRRFLGAGDFHPTPTGVTFVTGIHPDAAGSQCDPSRRERDIEGGRHLGWLILKRKSEPAVAHIDDPRACRYRTRLHDVADLLARP